MNEVQLRSSLDTTNAVRYPELDMFMRDHLLTERDVLHEFLEIHEQMQDFAINMTVQEVGTPWDGFVVDAKQMNEMPPYAVYVNSVYSLMYFSQTLVQGIENGFNTYGMHCYLASPVAQEVRQEVEEEVREQLLEFEDGELDLYDFQGDPSNLDEVEGYLFDQKMFEVYQRVTDTGGDYYIRRGVELRYGNPYDANGQKKSDYVSLIDEHTLHLHTRITAQWIDFASKRLRCVMYDPFGKMGLVPQREVW